jgi:hypothetical protein
VVGRYVANMRFCKNLYFLTFRKWLC